jgi:hypothetical protein
MKVSSLKNIIMNSLHIIWAVLITILFVFYSGTISHLYDSNFGNWLKFIPKLLQIDMAVYIKGLIISLLGIAAFTLACISLGSIFLNGMYPLEKPSLFDWIGGFVTAFLLGEIVFSFIMLAMGIWGKLPPSNTISVFLIGGGMGILSFRKLILACRKSRKSYVCKPGTKSERLIFWLSMAALASAVLLTTARLSYDSTAFYFSDAKLTAMTGQLLFFPNDSFVISSFHTGILYTALIQFAGDHSARLLSWVSGVLIVMICMALAGQVGLSNKGKIITLALLVTSTAFLDPLGDGKIELSSSLPALTAIYWLVRSVKENNLNNYLLAGTFAGFAIVSRPYNLMLLGGFIGIYFLTSLNSLKLRLRSYIAIAGPILFFLLLHLIANWMILGDPFAPINNASKVSRDGWQWSGFDPENIWLARIFFPFIATFFNTPQSMGNISPIMLIFLPVLFNKKTRAALKSGGDLKIISLISLFVLTSWIMLQFTIFEIRYVLFLWVIIYLAAAEIISTGLEGLPQVSRNIFLGTIVLLLAYIVARNIFIAVDAYAPIDKNGTPQCSDSPFCNYLFPINQNALHGERVLGLSAFRYYLRPELFACSSKANEYHKIRDALEDSYDDFWLEVQRQGYTYIAYEENYSTRHLKIDLLPAIANKPNWVNLEKLSETFDGYFSAYKIEFNNDLNHIKKNCVNNNGIWLVQEIP